MSTTFTLLKKEAKGIVPLYIRIQSSKPKINIRVKTNLLVPADTWLLDRKGVAFANFIKSEEGSKLNKKIIKIQDAINYKLESGVELSIDQVKEICDNIIYAEEREEEARLAEETRLAAERARKMTLSKYIKLFIEQIENGDRQTEKGTNYAKSTVRSIKQAMTQWAQFQEATGRTYDFDDIDMQCYYDYTAYLKGKNYAINSVGKCIKELKGILAAAESEGHHTNSKYKDKKFKGTRVEVDSVFLTKEELTAMMNADLSDLGPGYEIARDIFMVGVWTAQRVSDYNNISKKDINTYTRKYIVEEEDPNTKEKIEKVVREEVTYINIRQQKTGTKVAIPCSTELKMILEKYDYQMPHLEDQVINRYIKEVAKKAGICQLVEIETTKGGTPAKTRIEKHQLIHTHTARRTGATLMYLSGMDVYDIMKITGHSSPAMLKKYIKADQLQVVEKIMSKYNYFN